MGAGCVFDLLCLLKASLIIYIKNSSSRKPTELVLESFFHRRSFVPMYEVHFGDYFKVVLIWGQALRTDLEAVRACCPRTVRPWCRATAVRGCVCELKGLTPALGLDAYSAFLPQCSRL